MKTCPRIVPVLFLLTPLVSAQSLTLAAASPGFVHASAAGQTQVTPTPAGPLSTTAWSVVQASAGSGVNSASTALTWSVGGLSGHDFLVGGTCSVTGNGQSDVVPGDFLLSLSAATTGSVTIELSQAFYATSAVAPLQLRVDVDNNGSDELTELMTGPQQYVRAIGPVPLVIRVRMQGTLGQPGYATFSLNVAVTPGPHTQVQHLSSGCTTNQFLAFAAPLGDSLTFYVPCNSGNCVPRLVVLGLSLQPQILPSVNAWCGLLLPSPDALLYTGPNTSAYIIPLPPAARPIDIYAQAVWIYPGGQPVTTDSFRIAAY